MKKVGYFLVVIILLIGGIILLNEKDEKEKSTPKKEIKVNNKSVLDHEYYKGLRIEDIEAIDKIRYQESGSSEKTYTEPEDIEKIYNYWKNKKLGKETKKACEDNTTIYVFKLKENVSLSIEQECDWVTINNKRYLIK